MPNEIDSVWRSGIEVSRDAAALSILLLIVHAEVGSRTRYASLQASKEMSYQHSADSVVDPCSFRCRSKRKRFETESIQAPVQKDQALGIMRASSRWIVSSADIDFNCFSL